MDRLPRHLTDNLLVSVTVCFLAGATLAPRLPASWPVWTVLAPIGLCAVAALVLDPRFRPLTALPFFLLVGLLHTHTALHPPADPHHIAGWIGEKSRVTLTGRMLTMAEDDGEKTRFELAAESLLIHGSGEAEQPRPVRGRVQLTVLAPLGERFAPGTRLVAIATLDRIRNYQTPGAFDYRLQMAARDIAVAGWVRSAAEILAAPETEVATVRQVRFLPEQVRQHLFAFLGRHFGRDLAGMYQALLTGSLVNVRPALIEAFKANGCFHVLSISGLHFSLLGLFSVGLWTLLLKRSQWLLLHTHVPTLALVLTAPILLFYTCIAGMNVPAVRALITALLVLFAAVLRRQRSFGPLIAAAALIVLAVSPLALFTASFQLSFAAVLAINLIYPRLPALNVDPRDGWPRRALALVQSLLLVSVAATLGTLPFMLLHFNRISLIGPLANLVIEPLLCLWALPCGLLAIPFVGVAPGLAVLLFNLGSGGMRLALWLTELTAALPAASVWTITPNPAELILFFAALTLLLRPGASRSHRWAALALFVLLAGSFTRSLWPGVGARETLRATLLDVGQGSSTLIELPDGRTVLVDGGGYESDRFNVGEALIAPFLWQKRLWRLDTLVVTHPHKDHYNGLPFVFDRFRPGRVIVNGDSGEEPAYARFLARVRERGTPVQLARTGDMLMKGENLTLTCAGMHGLLDEGMHWSTNDRSMVLHLRYGQRSLLLPADISVAAEDRLVATGRDLHSDLLVAPHHGSATSAGPALMRAVSPAVVAVSVSRARRDTLPAPQHLQAWRAQGRMVVTTADQGTLVFSTDGHDLRLAPYTGTPMHFRAPDRSLVREN
ncbi:DNA internalization-related competence protein ComEC/Rec2 [uncultured Desulfobulbus sp.]|uniref:DNA internalization-related competence protein ComEC/Rec2 n=1 Tax=uncultured Desulfobulbus sp. TaxID=239745 RepID=UPI0026223DFA|nr:DNA internalization-related competence protein ComEC/Rec2 [uncultured Desulfobulbus sp.]